jgi:hypothetical protein
MIKMAGLMIYDPINRFFWTMAIFVLFICMLIYLIKTKNSNDPERRKIYLAFAFLFLGLFLSRLFYYIGEFYYEGEYIGHVYHEIEGDTLWQLNFFSLLGTLCFLWSMVSFFMVYGLPKKMKIATTIFNILFTILIFVAYFSGNQSLERMFNYIAVGIDILLFILILFQITNSSKEDFQLVAIFLLVGSTLLASGFFLDSRFLKQANVIPAVLPAFLIIFGSISAILPMIIKPKNYTKLLFFINFLSISFLIFLIIMMIFVINFFISNEINIALVVGICLGMLLALIIFIFTSKLTYNIFKSAKKFSNFDFSNPNISQESLFNLFLFSSPEKLTEEEVTISNEKNLCLACKKKLERDVYLCPNCHSKYCTHCTNILKNIENACWVCNTPLDPEKPIRTLIDPQFNVESEDPKKNILLNVVKKDFYEYIEQFQWNSGEKEEFIEYMLSLPPKRREEIIKEMLSTKSSLDETKEPANIYEPEEDLADE